jgi:tetratricopeptide (TPR) repeat protein
MIDFLKLRNFNSVNFYFAFIIIAVSHLTGCSKNPDELRKDAVKYFEQAVDYYSRGYYSNAEKLFNEVISIESKIKLKDYSGDSFLYLGIIAFEEGSFLNAIKFYESAKTIYKSKLLRNKESIAENNIANAYASIGSFYRAKEAYRNAIGISQLSADKEGEAAGCNNLGMLFFIEGNYQHAFNNFSKALDAYQFLNNIEGIILSSMRLGEAYLRFGSIQDALTTFEFCLNSSYETGFDKYLPGIYNNIGLCFFHLNNFAEAESAFERSLNEINNRNLISDYSWIAAVNLGDVYYKTYRFKDALNQYHNAIAILDELGEGLTAALVKLKTALIYLLSGLDRNEQDLGRAEMLFKNLTEYFDDLEFQSGMINSITGLAKCYLASNRREKTEALMKDLNRLIENHSVSLRNRITENFAIVPQITGRVTLNEYFTIPDKVREMIEFNLRIDENITSFLLRNQLYFNLGDEAKNVLIDSLKNLDAQIDFLTFEIANELSNEKYFNPEKIKSYKKLLREVRKKYDSKLINVLSEEFGLKHNISLRDIQKKLDTESAFLAFISFEDSLLSCIVSNNKIETVSIPFNISVLEGQISALAQNLEEVNDYSAANILNGLYNRIINPIEDYINSYKNLIIYTSGSDFLDMIPFHSLTDNNENTLINKHNVFYFSGISSDFNSTGSSIAIVHDSSFKLKNIDMRNPNVNFLETSSTLKSDLLGKDFNSILFLTGAYYNTIQNNLIYLETFSDSASIPEFNIKIGEAKALRAENILINNIFPRTTFPSRYLAGLFPNAKKVIIGQYKFPAEVQSVLELEMIKQMNVQTDFERILNKTSEALQTKNKIFLSAYFHYIRL